MAAEPFIFIYKNKNPGSKMPDDTDEIKTNNSHFNICQPAEAANTPKISAYFKNLFFKYISSAFTPSNCIFHEFPSNAWFNKLSTCFLRQLFKKNVVFERHVLGLIRSSVRSTRATSVTGSAFRAAASVALVVKSVSPLSSNSANFTSPTSTACTLSIGLFSWYSCTFSVVRI